MPDFIPGIELSRAFYLEAVRPILDTRYPRLPHAAALLGPGSEVLGFDDATSRDHHWGTRLDLHLTEGDHPRLAEAVRETLGRELPVTFRGYSTSYEEIPDEPGTLRACFVEAGPVEPFISVITLRDFVLRQLGVEPDRDLAAVDWLTFPEHRLRTVVAGAVFHDGLGELTALREKLAYYPDDVWRYLLASQWQRIGQEEPFVGRTGSVGDDIGSAVLAARLVRDVMRLAFLLERTYAPYPKWFGTGFRQLAGAEELVPHLEGALRATDWSGREAQLSRAYVIVAARTNALGLAEPQPAEVSLFHGRPFQVIHGDRFAEAIRATIADDDLRRLPLMGGVDQWSDSTDVLSYPERFRRATALYGA